MKAAPVTLKRVWRVEFVGDDFTSRETVETDLFYRADELTAQNGYDWFVSSTPAVSEETEIIVEAVRPQDHRAHYCKSKMAPAQPLFLERPRSRRPDPPRAV